jgi:hypothetical protein
LLEDEPGFTDVRIRSVGSQEENEEAAGEETGVGVGVGSGVGQLPGGPLAAPEDAEGSGHTVTFKLSVTRTPRLEAPISEEDAEAVGIELES